MKKSRFLRGLHIVNIISYVIILIGVITNIIPLFDLNATQRTVMWVIILFLSFSNAYLDIKRKDWEKREQ